MGNLREIGAKELFSTSLDPVRIELNRLENNLKDKERQLLAANSEIKALKATEYLKDKAVLELSNELKKLEEKLRTTEKNLEFKNLDLKRALDEKKEALAAQFAAEASLRRIYAAQKDDDSLPVEAIIAPYEADIKKLKNEIAKLQEDNRALERLTKSKEIALIEADKIVRNALEKAMVVENVQNQNIELKRQIEICQEENRILEKTRRQKVLEVEKLTQSIRELEESILAGGATANVVRDHQRTISEITEEKKALERELEKTKVSANRVATVVANKWKDDNDKVMPVKQWLEERRYFQGEIQQLRDKLGIAERTAKAEAQLKDKLRMRLHTLEQGMKSASASIKQNESGNTGLNKRSSSQPRASIVSNRVSTIPNQPNENLQHNEGSKKRSSSQPRASNSSNRSPVLQQPNSTPGHPYSPRNMKVTSKTYIKSPPGENLVRKNLWASRSKFADDEGKENIVRKIDINDNRGKVTPIVDVSGGAETVNVSSCATEPQNQDITEEKCEDMVSGFLYDKIQKEVIMLRKLNEEKNMVLSSKDDEIMMLNRKIETLTKSMEAELKKARRDAAAREKEAMQHHTGENKQKLRSITPRRGMRGAVPSTN